jgi:F1F0 ATPase subunit 2
MINDMLSLAVALAVGAGVGTIFFGGLWLTVLKLPTARWPVLLMMGSMLGRTGIALVSFYLIMNGSWQRLLVCVLGFILMRQLFIHRLRPPQPESAPIKQE